MTEWEDWPQGGQESALCPRPHCFGLSLWLYPVHNAICRSQGGMVPTGICRRGACQARWFHAYFTYTVRLSEPQNSTIAEIWDVFSKDVIRTNYYEVFCLNFVRTWKWRALCSVIKTEKKKHLALGPFLSSRHGECFGYPLSPAFTYPHTDAFSHICIHMQYTFTSTSIQHACPAHSFDFMQSRLSAVA